MPTVARSILSMSLEQDATGSRQLTVAIRRRASWGLLAFALSLAFAQVFGLPDDEFRARAAAILQRDARLVAILDACHSATGFRAVGGEVGGRPPEMYLLKTKDEKAALEFGIG